MVSKKNDVKNKKKVTAPEAVKPAVVNKVVNNIVKNPNVIDFTPSTYGVSGKEGMLESTEVYDEADIASALEQGLIAQALANHHHKVAPESHPDFDGEHCIDCEVKIPQARLALGKIRCVDCQTDLEHFNKINSRR